MSKILLLISHASVKEGNRGVGGVEILIREFLLKRNDQKLSYVAGYSPDGALWDEFSNIDGLELVPLEFRGARDFWVVIRILKVIKDTGVKAVHCQGPVTLDFYASIACWKAEVTYAITRHSLISDYLMPTWKKTIYKLFDRIAILISQKVIAVSDNGLNSLKSGYVPADKLVKILNGVDIERFKKQSPKSSDIVTFGTVAQFTYGKGQDVFIEAFAKAKEKTDIPMRGILIGSGPLISEMKDLAKSLGVFDELEFTGFANDIPGKLALMDALFLLSYREGLPVSLIEGCVAGLPVVGTDAGGTSEIVKDGKNGFLVPVADSEIGAEAMIKLAQNIDLRKSMGKYSENLGKSKFSLQKMIVEYERFYMELLDSELIY